MKRELYKIFRSTVKACRDRQQNRNDVLLAGPQIKLHFKICLFLSHCGQSYTQKQC